MAKNTSLTEAVFYILLAVRKPNHGYGIIQAVSDMTNGRVNLGSGTIYGAINSMMEKGWIQLHSVEKISRKKKEYLITDSGKEMFGYEMERLCELLENAKLLQEDS